MMMVDAVKYLTCFAFFVFISGCKEPIGEELYIVDFDSEKFNVHIKKSTGNWFFNIHSWKWVEEANLFILKSSVVTKEINYKDIGLHINYKPVELTGGKIVIERVGKHCRLVVELSGFDIKYNNLNGRYDLKRCLDS